MDKYFSMPLSFSISETNVYKYEGVQVLNMYVWTYLLM